MSKKRSDVWMHFEVLSDDKNKAKCSYCKKFFSISSGSLGNLNRHMKRMHPTIPITRSSVLDATISKQVISENLELNNDGKY